MLRLGNKIDRVGGRKAKVPLEAPPLLHREGQVHFPSDIMDGAYPSLPRPEATWTHIPKTLGCDVRGNMASCPRKHPCATIRRCFSL